MVRLVDEHPVKRGRAKRSRGIEPTVRSLDHVLVERVAREIRLQRWQAFARVPAANAVQSFRGEVVGEDEGIGVVVVGGLERRFPMEKLPIVKGRVVVNRQPLRIADRILHNR